MTKDSFLQALQKDIEQYVIRLFQDNPVPSLAYHNLDHTLAVVERSQAIVGTSIMNDENRFVLYAAAWFHDTGHLFADQKIHEEVSMHIAGQFLNRYPQISQEIVVRVERCILSTKMPQVPCTTPENILCDADTFHFGTPAFFVTDELMKEETLLKGGSIEDWDAASLRLLQKHSYHTNYCRVRLNPGKEANMALLEARLSNL